MLVGSLIFGKNKVDLENIKSGLDNFTYNAALNDFLAKTQLK